MKILLVASILAGLLVPAQAISIDIQASEGVEVQIGSGGLGPDDWLTLNGKVLNGKKEWQENGTSYYEVWWNGLLIEFGQVNETIGMGTFVDYYSSEER